MTLRARAAALAALVVATPASAFACPSCATREGPGLGTLALVGAMIVVPYLVAMVVVRIVRRLDGDSG